jgi:hypothetical protein
MVTALKGYVQDSLKERLYVALINLDIKGTFNAAWWPGTLSSLKALKYPKKNLYNLSKS